MRIALVVTGGVDRSGREKVIPTLLWLIERLARRHELTIYALRYHEEACTYSLLGATVCDLGRPVGISRQYRRLVDAMKRDGPFDVIHGYWGLPSGLVAAAAGRRLGVPSVVTCDSGEFVALPDIGYGSQIRFRQRMSIAATTSLARRITVCTKYQAALAGRCGFSTQVIPLGVDSRVFAPAGRPDGPPWRLLHVASLNPVKDHETLLRAFQLIVRSGIDAHLDIVGEDTMGGAALTFARQMVVDERITFHGFCPVAALVPIYQQSHLFVLSSRHEAAGAVILEAAVCGVPVVGTAVGYVADWAPECAVAVPTQNAEALGIAIRTLLGDPARMERLSFAARKWALAHDADWTAARIERVYTELVTPGS